MTEHKQSDCTICKRASDKRHVVFEDENWIVRHSDETNILGYMVLEPRRHLLDLSHTNDSEAGSHGQVLRLTMKAVREVIDCERIYTFSLGESCPHYHLHVIPRTESTPKTYRARGIMQYPLEPTADPALVDEVCARMRRAIARIRSSQNVLVTSPFR